MRETPSREARIARCGAWGLPVKPRETERLFRMIASQHGGLWNTSQIGAGLGLSYHTVNYYLG
jgi:DNA-binding CsgD family transcriptional regulator